MSTEVNAGGAAQPVAPATPPGAQQAATGAAGGQGKIDLTSIPEFRTVQSEYDRKLAARDREMAEMRAQLAQLQQAQAAKQVADLDSLDPAEQAKALKTILSQKAAEEAKAAEQARFAQAGSSALAEAGLTWSDPRLAEAVALGPTAEGVLALNRAIASIALAEKKELEAKLANVGATAGQVAQTAAAQAKVEALVAAGVTATSNGGGSAINPPGQREQQLAAFKARFASMSGQGHDGAGVHKLRTDMAEAGFSFGDLT